MEQSSFRTLLLVVVPVLQLTIAFRVPGNSTESLFSQHQCLNDRAPHGRRAELEVCLAQAEVHPTSLNNSFAPPSRSVSASQHFCPVASVPTRDKHGIKMCPSYDPSCIASPPFSILACRSILPGLPFVLSSILLIGNSYLDSEIWPFSTLSAEPPATPTVLTPAPPPLRTQLRRPKCHSSVSHPTNPPPPSCPLSSTATSSSLLFAPGRHPSLHPTTTFLQQKRRTRACKYAVVATYHGVLFFCESEYLKIESIAPFLVPLALLLRTSFPITDGASHTSCTHCSTCATSTSLNAVCSIRSSNFNTSSNPTGAKNIQTRRKYKKKTHDKNDEKSERKREGR